MSPNLRAPSEIFRARWRTRPRCAAFPSDLLRQHIEEGNKHAFHNEDTNLFLLCRQCAEVDCTTKAFVAFGWLTCAVLLNIRYAFPNEWNTLRQACLRLDPTVRASGHVTCTSARVNILKDAQMCFSQSRLLRVGNARNALQSRPQKFGAPVGDPAAQLHRPNPPLGLRRRHAPIASLCHRHPRWRR